MRRVNQRKLVLLVSPQPLSPQHKDVSSAIEIPLDFSCMAAKVIRLSRISYLTEDLDPFHAVSDGEAAPGDGVSANDIFWLAQVSEPP